MNTTDDKVHVSLDDAEDLTLYADEEFDTDDVDLFEFTSLDDSPLTLLKSIIISLDWEITEEILQSLIAEIQNLYESFSGDKVVQVYLQGLDKLGRYILRKLGAAHPNAIKLLNTYYYNLETIISSPDITNEKIISLLKNDARKFKILQYQINTQENIPTPESATIAPVMPELLEGDEKEALRGLKASILELDWEINDTYLDNFSQQLENLKQLTDNYYATILLKGLGSMCSYIADERSATHPETFSILHTFYDCLEKILLDMHLEDEQAKKMTIDCITSINNLKAIIANGKGSATIQDINMLSPESAMSSPPVASDHLEHHDDKDGPDHEQIADPLEHTKDDFFFEEEQAIATDPPSAFNDTDKEAEITAALSDFEKERPVEGEEEPDTDIANDLQTQFSSFFSEQSVEPEPTNENSGEEYKGSSAPGEQADKLEELTLLDDDAITAIDEDVDFEQFTTVGEFSEDELDLKKDFGESLTSFIGLRKEDHDQQQDQEPPAADMADLPDSETSIDIDFEGFDDIDIDEITPALSDNEDDTGFREEHHEHEIDEQFSSDLDDKLSLFFGEEESEPSLLTQSSDDTKQAESLAEEIQGDEREADLSEVADAREPAGASVEEQVEDQTLAILEEPEGQTHEEEISPIIDESALEDETEQTTELLSEPEKKVQPSTDIKEGKIILFGDQDVAEATAIKSTGKDLDEQEYREKPDEIAPALAGAMDDSDIRELEADKDVDDDSVTAIEEQLSSYFVDSQPGEETAAGNIEDITSAQLSELEYCINELIDSPSQARYAKCFAIINEMHATQSKNIEHVILCHLLKSVLSIREHQQLEKLPDHDSELLSFFSQHLREDKTTKTGEKQVLVEAITKYTDWQKALYEPPVSATTISEKELIYQTVAKEVKTGFDKICSLLKQEIAAKR